MKKLFLLVVIVAMLLPSCKKINEAIDDLDNRLNKLEQETIPSIDEQISAINTTLGNLDAMDKELKGYIDNLTATASSLQEQINATNTKIGEVKAELKGDIVSTNSELKGEIAIAKADVLAQLEALETELKNELATINTTIDTLKAKDTELDNKIAELRSYVDTELGKTTDWVNATFATLEQYNALVSEVATIKEQIKAINQSITDLETRLTTKINEDIAKAVSTLNADIQQKVKEITDAYTNAIKSAKEEITAAYTKAIQNAINALDASLKSWVGEQLSNYYTIAEIDAKILALQTAITDGDKALQEQINALKSQLKTAKAELTEAYKKAIKEAIETNNGVINTKIANEIASVNQRIDSEVATINAKIATLEAQVNKNTEDIAKLLARIQSISYIPTYSDGKATVKFYEKTSQVTLDFEISPKDVVAELAKVWENAISLKAVYTQTRAVSFIDMPIVKFEADAENGVISIIASGENLSEEFFAGAQSASAALTISDGNSSVTSEYVPMIAQEADMYQLSVPANQIWYTSTDNNVVEPFNKDGFGAHIVSNTYENGRGTITFDTPVTKIGDSAFDECSTLKNIAIPNSVTLIGLRAFCNCTSLTSITIPDSVTSIGDDAFAECTSLTRVDISDLSAWCKISFGSYDANPLCYAKKLYLNGSELTEINIPSDITEIKPYVFYNCTSLTSITIPDSVTEIGNAAFCDCNRLKSVTISDSVTSIRWNVFYHRGSLTRLSIENVYVNITDLAKYTTGNPIAAIIIEGDRHLLVNGVEISELVIPDGVTSIGDWAFHYCTSLTSVKIPNSVVSIGNTPFLDCTSLTAFYGKYASEDNRCLIVDGVLNSFAPAGLTKYTIPDSVTSINHGVFYDCTSLTNVTIPDSVTSIGDETFYGCTSLTSVTIPDRVTSIGFIAFCECTSLKEIYCKPITPPIFRGGDILADIVTWCKFYVPRNSVEAYKSAEYWSGYADYIVGYDF